MRWRSSGWPSGAAEDVEGAGDVGLGTHDGAHEGGLSAAGGAEEAGDAAAGDVEGDAVDDGPGVRPVPRRTVRSRACTAGSSVCTTGGGPSGSLFIM